MKKGIKKRVISFCMAVVLVFAGVLAVPTDAEAATQKLTLSAAKMTVYVGKTESLTVKKAQGLSNKNVTYKSSNADVATVTAKGKIKGISVGSAVITVTSKANSKVTATCKVTVKQPVKAIQTASKLTLQKGKKVGIAYSLVPQTAANKKVTFKSMNNKVATVTAKGVVKGKKAGSTKIKITSKDGQATATIKVAVKKSITAVSKVSLNKTSVSLPKGAKETLKATVTPKNATSSSVYWVSSNPDVATVSAKGAVTAVTEGTTTITAYAADNSGKKAGCTVTVTSVNPNPVDPVDPDPVKPDSTAVPVLTVDSNLYGSVYTNGKSTLKGHLNNVVDYDSSSKAVLKLTMPDGSSVDDSKIDISKAKISLVDGDGYYPSEYTFKATELKGSFSNGSLVYTLSKGDLEVNRSQYTQTDSDSGREWSCLGGDGHGNYVYNLEVSGITYNGEAVASQTFQAKVYVYGYNYTSDAINLYGEDGTPAIEAEFKTLSESLDGQNVPPAGTEPIWTWVGEGEKPILCDQKADDFYITWPTSIDASSLAESDVKITLTGEWGDTKELKAEEDFKVNSIAGETQIALIYRNWAFIPVYTKMTVAVNGTNAKAEKTFDIASVYVYEAQQGGGGTTVDGTVTAYNFYGLANLTNVTQLLSSDKSTYTLSYDDNGTTKYYTEQDGIPALTEEKGEAKLFTVVDGDGLDGGVNPKLVGNAVYTTTRQNRKVSKTVGGVSIEFTCNFDRVGLLSPSQCDQELKAEPGYVIPWGTSNWITNEKWAWQKGIEEGWTGIAVNPYTGKYEYNVAKGTTQQFTADYDGTLIWKIYGDVAAGTSVTQNGLLVVAADETAPQFAVTVEAADGSKGTVTVNVKEPAAVLTVDSQLYGTAFTHGKTGLVVELTRTKVDWGDTAATFKLAMSDNSAIDDNEIDCTNAKVQLTDGDGYYVGEYVFTGTELDGTWRNGQYTYTLDKDDLAMDLSTYQYKDTAAVREVSSLGGDGQGNHYLNLTVSGIKYNGKEVAAQTFPIHFYIFGRDYTPDALTLYGDNGTAPIEAVFTSLADRKDFEGEVPEASDKPVWTWVGDGDKPILCDNFADDFYITWPSGTSASGIAASNVQITLYSQYGDSLELNAGTDYQVNSSAAETQIALIYQNWAFVPVYNTMTVEVDVPGGTKVSETFDIASVYVYETQQGGAGPVSMYSFYGFENLSDWKQIMSPAVGLLSMNDNGVTKYYAEDEDGTAYLTEDDTKAWKFDASTDRNQQLQVNTVFVTKMDYAQEKTVTKTVDGQAITFTKTSPGRGSTVNGGGALLTPKACDPNLKPAPGYAIPWGTDNWITNEKWAWQANIAKGWTGLIVSPFDTASGYHHYKYSVAKGSEQKFTASLTVDGAEISGVEWYITTEVDEGTSISENGTLTISASESHTAITIGAIAPDGKMGSVNVTVTTPPASE